MRAGHGLQTESLRSSRSLALFAIIDRASVD